MPLLNIDRLDLAIGGTPILKGVSLSVEPGEILAIVGESGSGKSLTALSVMQLLPNASQTGGEILFDGTNLLQTDEDRMCELRGDDIGMIFQEPMTALNPVMTIGDQIVEGIRIHTGETRRQAESRAAAMLERVGLPPARFPLSRYPHELSGGQRQRVVIAIACALNPRLLIADEPTTALDVTIQAQILDLLRSLVAENGMGLVFITHDLAVVAELADKIAVMRNGEVLESGPALQVLRERRHPYTRQLAEASSHVPQRTAHRHTGVTREPVLKAEGLVRDYPSAIRTFFGKGQPFRAVDNVDLSLFAGQSLGLVGESGCGKSTLARMLLALDQPTAGKIHFEGAPLDRSDPDGLRRARRHMQVVFQDPYGSFNPRHKVSRLVSEPLHLTPQIKGAEKEARIVRSLEEVGLHADDRHKYPHEFSGGQRQRIAIARALITEPKLIIADEPVSALDVSIRAQILDLFAELQDRLDLGYLFISHDLTVVRAICDEVLVMRAGRIVEHGAVEQVFDNPQQEYTRELIAAAPDLKRALDGQTRTRSQGVA